MAFSIHLIDKHNDGSFPHATDIHKFAGLGFNTFGSINDNNNTVNCGQCAECVFSKILMTRCVKDVDLVILIVKFHDGSSDGDSSLFFNLHPVAGSSLTYFIVFYCTCHLYLTSKKQELFC